MITLSDAKTLRKGLILRSTVLKNSDGTPQRYKILSVKTLKRKPEKVLISCKRGLSDFVTFNETQLNTIL